MYTVTDQEKEAYKQNGSVKRGYISVVPLSEYEEEVKLDDVNYIKSFTILDDIYTPDQGVVGSVISKQLSLELFTPVIMQDFPITYEEVNSELKYNDLDTETYSDYADVKVSKRIDLVNREVKVYIGIQIQNESKTEIKYIPFGTYIIQKPENGVLSDTTKFDAFDYMIKFNKTFEDTLTYPCTVKDLYLAICEQCGVTSGTDVFVNDDFQIENNQFVAGEKCRDVLKAITQISGTYARIGRDDKLYLNFFDENTNVEVFDNHGYMQDIKVNQKFGPVNRLVLRMSQVEGENVVRQDDSSIEQIGLKELVISDNPFTYTQEKREQAISELWEKLKGFEYTDFETKSVPRPYLDCGDKLLIQNADATQFYTYLMSHELVFNGGLTGTMSATADTETETKYAFQPELIERVKHTEFVVDKANQTITSIVETQGEQQSEITRIKQALNNISADVKTIGGNNKQENSVGAFGTNEYEQSEDGEILAYEDNKLKTSTVSGRAIKINDNKWFKMKSTNLVIGEQYTLSFKYSNTELNSMKISLINNVEIVLVETNKAKDLTEFQYTFIALADTVELYVKTGNYSMTITDYYLQSGNAKSQWQPAPRRNKRYICKYIL